MNAATTGKVTLSGLQTIDGVALAADDRVLVKNQNGENPSSGNGIYVVEDGRVKRRKVELGYVSLNIVEDTKGLKAGEVVIVDDIDKYREGDRVNTEVVK